MPIELPEPYETMDIDKILAQLDLPVDASQNSHLEREEAFHHRQSDAYLKINEQPHKFLDMKTDRNKMITGQNGNGLVTVQIMNHVGVAVVYASLVTNENSPHPHPNGLRNASDPSASQDGCYFVLNLDETIQNPEFECRDMGFVAVNRQHEHQHIKDSLKRRKDSNVNPFRNIDENRKFTSDELNYVRICFEAVIVRDGCLFRLSPVLSQPILNVNTPKAKKALAAGSMKIERVCPQRISFPSFELCVLTSQDIDKSYSVSFRVEGQTFTCPMKSVHNKRTIYIDDCHLNIPDEREVQGQIFLIRQSDSGQPIPCSNEYEVTVERRQTTIDQEGVAVKRQRRQ